MDNTQRNSLMQAGSRLDFTIAEENNSVGRLAPVSINAGNQLTNAFSELSEHWKKYTQMEEGDKIGEILKNYSVEEQIERMQNMPKEDILNVVRFHLRKMETLKEENDMVTTRNREISEKLHMLEHRVGKAQNEVFEKMQTIVSQVVNNFHERELDLARNLEQSDAEKLAATSKCLKLEKKIEEFEEKIDNMARKSQSIEQTNQNLIGSVEAKQKLFEELAKKYDEQGEEIFELREQLEKTKQLAREKSDDAVEEAMKAQKLRILMVKQKDEAWEQTRRHEEAMKEDMDAYRSNIEHQMNQMRRKCKEELESMAKEHRTVQFQKDTQINKLSEEVARKTAEVEKFERHLAMMEAQIKGNMKRSLAVNYQEMLNIISTGPSEIPTPPYSNPLLDLARDLDKENASNKRMNSNRSSNPPSPKRHVGIQAAEPEPPKIVRRAMPVTFASRKPSTSSSLYRK